MRPRATARTAKQADLITEPNLLSFFNKDFVQVGKTRLQSGAMVNLDHLAKTAFPASKRHDTGRGNINAGIEWTAHVETIMGRPFLVHRVAAFAVPAGHTIGR